MPTASQDKQQKKSGKAATRSNEIKDLWTAPAKSVEYGREQFRFRLQRTARRLPTLDIDAWVTSADWQRSGPNRTGELNFERPLSADAVTMVAYGDEVLCDWSESSDGGPWNRLWVMKVNTPSQQILEGILSMALSSQLDELTKNKVGWKFKTDKQHPHGWTADEITANVCKRFHIPLKAMPKGTYRIPKFSAKSESPEDVITWAWGQENKHTGRRFDLDASAGFVVIRELAEPQYMLLLGASILDATVKESMTGIASAVIAVASHKVAGKKKHDKIRVKVVDEPRLERYGYIVKTMRAPSNITTAAALKQWATKRLATMYRSRKSVQFSHPGIPLVDRGSALQLYIPEADLKQIVFVTSVDQSVSAGAYVMQVTVGFDDPFAADLAKAKVQQAKDAKAAERARAKAKKAAAAKAADPTPAKAKTRSNKS